MVYLRFEALPDQVVADRDEVIGAYINCWVRTDDPAQAEAEARRVINEKGWTVVSVEECRAMTPDEFRTNHKYVDEAEASGSSFVFHTWGAGGDRSGLSRGRG